MKAAIDTSSLLSLVRYYLPFDKEKILFDLIKQKIENKEIIILDKVFKECCYVSEGLVTETLNYLKGNQTKTTNLLPYKKFFNLVENNFISSSIKKMLAGGKLDSEEFEKEKDKFLVSADCKLLLYSKKNINIVIISEETRRENDNKPFKKLPSICDLWELKIMTLPELLKEYNKVDFEFKLKKIS